MCRGFGGQSCTQIAKGVRSSEHRNGIGKRVVNGVPWTTVSTSLRIPFESSSTNCSLGILLLNRHTPHCSLSTCWKKPFWARVVNVTPHFNPATKYRYVSLPCGAVQVLIEVREQSVPRGSAQAVAHTPITGPAEDKACILQSLCDEPPKRQTSHFEHPRITNGSIIRS